MEIPWMSASIAHLKREMKTVASSVMIRFGIAFNNVTTPFTIIDVSVAGSLVATVLAFVESASHFDSPSGYDSDCATLVASMRYR